MKTLITGANGFIGSNLIKFLLNNNIEVKAFLKKNAITSNLDDLDIEIAAGDIRDVDSIKNALKGCDKAYHLAAYYSLSKKDTKEMYDVTVNGTKNFYEAVYQNKNIVKCVHISSTITIGPSKQYTTVNEDTGTELLAQSCPYGKTKLLSEKIAIDYAAKGVPCTIVNPGLIFGENDIRPTPSGEIIYNFLNRRYPAIPQGYISIAGVDDISVGLSLATKHGFPGERYILASDRTISVSAFFKILENLSGVPSPSLTIPNPILAGLSKIDNIVSKTLMNKRFIFPDYGISFLNRTTKYSNAKAKTQLGFNPNKVENILKKAIEWHKENKPLFSPLNDF